MKKTIVRLTALSIALGAAAALALAAAQPAQGSRGLIKGIFDEAETIGRPAKTFPLLRTLRTEAVRVNLVWSDVASSKPRTPADPADKAYRWEGYDRMVRVRGPLPHQGRVRDRRDAALGERRQGSLLRPA